VSDEIVAVPSPAQLAAAGLVALPNAVVTTRQNTYAVKRWVNGEFVTIPVGTLVPAEEILYAVPGWPNPRPKPVVNPSGQAPLPVRVGFKRVFLDDFTDPTLSLAQWYRYNGVPGGTNPPGRWLTSHVVFNGDSIARLQAYQDVAGNDPLVNNWVGGAMQTVTRWPVGSVVTVRQRNDLYKGLSPILLLMGDSWPPEIDFDENGYAFIHWGKNNSQQGFTIPAKYDDTAWHTWQCSMGATQIDVSVDGVQFVSVTNPDQTPGDANNLEQPMFLSTQLQTGDFGEGPPANDPSVTSTNPVQQELDWVTVDVPV
jgi:hypothetical protein